MAEKNTPKSKKKLSKTAKIWIIIGVVCAGLICAWLAIAAILSNLDDRCVWYNNYCKGVFPFEKGYTGNSEFPNDSYPSHDGHHYEVKKPIIYLYPETTTEVQVTLGHPEKLTASYPKYESGWHVLAEPNGKLTDLSTGRALYSLYWEGSEEDSGITNEGFVVKGSEITEFLEEKLAILGLNEREAEEFIVYWLPVLQNNDYNYIRFATSAEIEEKMPLNVKPAPDTIIRVLMITKPLEQPIEVQEQILPETPARNGFTIVEWGGTK